MEQCRKWPDLKGVVQVESQCKENHADSNRFNLPENLRKYAQLTGIKAQRPKLTETLMTW